MWVQDVRSAGRGMSAGGALAGSRRGVFRCGVRVCAALFLLVVMGAGRNAGAPDPSAFGQGYEAYQRGEFARARALWEPLARAGDPRAQYNLGLIHAEGRGVRRNEARALDLWTRAAEAGHVRAMHNLALAHIAGVPSEEAATDLPDYGAALKWLKEAANRDFPHSIYSLGELYEHGLGVKRDPAQAAALFRKSAQKGLARAQYTLAEAYREGTGVKQDMAEALKWCLLAAKRGNASARDTLDDLIVEASLTDLHEATKRARTFETAHAERSVD